ncbi:glycosyltransferase family 4 protein [Halalkalibacter okhensis]|uniref:Glycosyl transferase n=1 Tax=Halalkalibacter okhensis TaxID=333138 RepID=A0A0B0IIU9_9BACI|nr:glycosyltransferase family 4 protein [Halalkalibacter okhensis]KHF39601.1 glycosyl transferase [Halalkalibacter okhensis]
MKVLHLISGGETGGSKNHLISLLEQFPKGEIVLGVMQKGQLYEEAVAAGLDVQLFRQNSRYDLSILATISTFIKNENISIMHTHGPRANLLGFFIKKRVRCLWVTTVHSDPRDDFINGGIKGKLFTKLNLTILKKLDFYFAVSNRFKDMLVEFGIDGNKIKAIYNGISFDEPVSNKLDRASIGVEDSDFVIAMVARLHPIKGHTEVLRVVKKLVDQKVPVKLLLIGDGPYKDEVVKKIQEHDLSDSVKLLGFQKDVHAFFQVSNVKLLASYSESFPLVILEAARAKTPVISTDVGGVKDLISDSSLGWVVPVKDEEALFQAILDAYNKFKQGELDRVGTKLYEKASTTYSIDQLYHEVQNQYAELL